MNYIDMNLTVRRAIKFFGKQRTKEIIKSRALICVIKMPDKVYYVGYSIPMGKFYSASFFPQWLLKY